MAIFEQGSPMSIALSGGGARAFMHIGVLKALEEAHEPPRALAGCSMGAVIAALYGAGHSSGEILQIFEKLSLRKAIGLSGRRGLFSLRPFARQLSPFLPKRLEELPLPVTINATDLHSAQSVYFSEGELLPLLAASCSIPLFFAPVPQGEMLLADGGITDNLPIRGLPESGYRRWASACNGLSSHSKVSGITPLLERTFRLAINQNTLSHRHECEAVLEPEGMGKFRITHFRFREEMVEVGYQAAQQQLADLRQRSHE